MVVLTIFYLHPASLAHADAAGVFASVLDLHGRAMPSPLTADWWIGNCAEIDVTTARLSCMWILLHEIKRREELLRHPGGRSCLMRRLRC